MASSLSSNLFSSITSPTKPASASASAPNLTIRCGPRDNRSPLSRGRILSIESIQAIQALKRAKSDETKLTNLLTKTLTRLVKKDLLSSLNELLRQNQCHLALKVFSTVRSEIWYRPDCGLYADIVLALARNGMVEEIDEVIGEFEREGLGNGEKLSRLVKALTGAERKEAVVRVYQVMKKSGGRWRSKEEDVDEYVVKVLSRGLRRLGEKTVADEVEREFGELLEGQFVKMPV